MNQPHFIERPNHIYVLPPEATLMDVSLIGLREHPEQGIATISSFLDEVDTVFHELNTYLSEATQNRLRNYFKVLTLNPEHSEQFNPLIQRTTKALQEALRRERQNLVEVSFEELTAEYSEQELHLIGQEISVIQLTVGCSVGCPSCSPMALTGVRRILSWDAIQEICLNWTESLSKNNVFFHWSSDSGDWKDSSGKTFRDVIQLLAEKYNYFPEITSAIPKGYEDEFKDLWSSVENQMRFSASNINLQRVLGEVPSREGISTSDILNRFGLPKNSESHFVTQRKSHKALVTNLETAIPETGLSIPAGKLYTYRGVLSSVSCRHGVIISPDGICNLQSAPTSPISPTGYVRTPVLPKGIVYQHQIAQGCELNNLRPLRTISLHEEQKEVTQFPRLNDVQCFHALYEIAADTLLESGLFDRADLFESPFDREVIQEKEREHYHLLRVAQKRGFLFAAYLHPEFEEAVLHRPKNPKMLSISGYLNSMRLFSCDTMASTVRSQGATPLRFEGGKLTPQVCDLIEQLHDYVAANRYTLRLLEDSLSYLLQHASSQWKPSTEHVRDALSLALSTSAEIFANRRDMPDIEKVLRLGTCLVLMDPKNSPLKDIKKSSYHDLKSVCATILSTLQGNHQTA